MNSDNADLQSILDCHRIRHTESHPIALKNLGCLNRRNVKELIHFILKAVILGSYAPNCGKGEFKKKNLSCTSQQTLEERVAPGNSR